MNIVRYLLDHGANPDNADIEGLTPLHEAAKIGNSILSLSPSWLFLCIALSPLLSWATSNMQVMNAVIFYLLRGLRLVDEERRIGIAIVGDRSMYLC